MLDFNAMPVAACELDSKAQRDAIKRALLERLPSVLITQFPAGKIRGHQCLIGNTQGEAGESLEIVLIGDKAGLWHDHATGEGGDLFDLIAAHHRLDTQADFQEVLSIAEDWAGQAALHPAQKRTPVAPVDALGPHTAKWDYLDAKGHLIACVYRYEPEPGKKEYRPWDAQRRKMTPPEPRPLYNQPGMVDAEQVILVEGEKCAQSLCEAGFTATTAMHGANAPIDKTDWTPLVGKAVLIWPDKDKPGWAYADAAAQAVLKAGASRCDILMPPDTQPEGWDVADALAEAQADRTDEDPLPFDVAGFIASGPRMTVQAVGHQPALSDDEVRVDSDTSGDRDATVWGTEDALAVSFTRRYQRDWRYIAAWGKWLMWDGLRWRSEETLAATDLIRHVCRHAAMRADNSKVAAKLAACSTVGGVERLARTDRRHAATTDEWDADLWLINTPGGVVDLRTGRMRPNDRANRMTKITTATPMPGSHCPTWLRFLDQVTGGDVQLQAYLQRVVGYCLTGSTQEHALFFLYGTGANGKSVFVNTLFTLLGDYATNAPMDTFMESRGDRHPTDLAGLRGSRFVGATETEQGRRWNESKIKEITGGDRVSARFMRQDFFTYVPQFKLVIAGNHKPAIRNIDEAMRRRLHLIPFTITVPPEKRDQQLQAKLLREANGIFSWGLEGCLAWQREGLKPPKPVLDATDEYFESEDALGQWLEERCVMDRNARAQVSDLYADWKDWAEERGEYVGAIKRFSDALENRRFEKSRISTGRIFIGISLRPKNWGGYTPYQDD